VVSKISWAVSGISYLATSKGPSDHAVSYVMKKDCSVMRMLLFQPICVPVSENTNQTLWAKLKGGSDEIADVPPPPTTILEDTRVVAR